MNKRVYISVLLLVILSAVFSEQNMYAQKRKTKKQARQEQIDALMALEAPTPAPYDDSARFERGYVVPPKQTLDAEPASLDTPAPILSRTELTPPVSSFSLSLLDEAMSHLGSRYKYGSSGPNSFDCSGFVMYCFKQMGISLPHSSRDLYARGQAIEFMDELRPGDLVFFRGRNVASSIGHVGIVTEVNGEHFSFVHASTSSGVIVSNYDEAYYHSRYVGARRFNPAD